MKITEKYITGFFFIIWGIYKGYYPFIQPEFWLAPWSYVGGAVLTNILGILILLIYFKKNEVDLIDSEQRFRLLAENAPDFIYRYRYLPTPGFDYVSPAVVRITDYTPEELYADPEIFFRQVHPEDQPILEKSLKNPGKSSNDPIVLRRIRKDGLIVWTEQHYSVIRDELNNVIAIEGILRDITERKLTEENLFRLEKFRRDLLSNISHELKTPITSIQGYIEAILDGVIVGTENFTKYLNLIHTRTLGLNRLIQDLIQLTQLETKQIDFQMYEISVLDLLEQIHNKYELDIEKSGLKFKMHPISYSCHQDCYKKNICCTSHDLIVTIDPDRIDQVFGNLIFNAIKHTAPGGIINMYFEIIPYFEKFLDCTYKDSAKDIPSLINLPKRELVIKIQDNGCGINSEEIPHIFDRFYKGSNANNHPSKGSGLGLSIAKEIIQAHGGHIWVHSKVNQGSTFCFTLPIHAEKDPILDRNETNTST
ncbi:ATP-binding protein [Clostridiaceae bacterium 35-E11]